LVECVVSQRLLIPRIRVVYQVYDVLVVRCVLVRGQLTRREVPVDVSVCWGDIVGVSFEHDLVWLVVELLDSLREVSRG